MIPLSSAISSGLSWAKLPRGRGYELRWDGEVVGTLHRPSFWCTKFLAESQDGQWTFRRGGFLGTGSEIVDSASDQPIATFKSSWGSGGILTFADGQVFHLECKGWWRPVWSVKTETGVPVLQLHSREKTVDLPTGAAVNDGRRSLLILFAWYRMLQAEEDAASAAVMVAAIS
jgi:hypothetical protein